MAKVALYNMEGTKTGDMEVSDAIFAAEVNKSVLHQVVVNYLANQRQGTQSTNVQKFVAAALSLGDKRVQVVQDKVVSVLHSGLAVA